MAKLSKPALLRTAGGFVATAMVALSVTSVALAPAQAAGETPLPPAVSVSSAAGATYAIPAGVHQITVTAQGAAGGNSAKGVTGGAGALVSATVAVAPGDVVSLFGATRGGDAGKQSFPGGGLVKGGSGGSGTSVASGAGGGGAAGLQVNGVTQVPPPGPGPIRQVPST